MQIATVMTQPVKTIETEAPLGEAYQLMQRHRIKHLPVVHNQRVVGLITARHLSRVEPSVIRPPERPSPTAAYDSMSVRDVMTSDVTTLPPETSAHEAARLAWERDIGCFLIVDRGALMGIVTTTDLLDLVIDRLEASASNPYQHLLLATDFKAAAAQALPTAVSLARRHRAKLTLVHVLPHLTRFLSTDIEHASAETVAMLIDAGRAEALTGLETLIPADLDGLSYCVTHGDSATAIVNTAIATQSDLIILGHRQRRRPYGLRRGVTKRVIKHARCPVLLVQTEAHYELVRP